MIRFILTFTVLAVTTNAMAGKRGKISVLWLGNSFTGMKISGYDIPKMTEELVNAGKGRVRIEKSDRVILWGRTLKDHWEHKPKRPSEQSSLQKIRSREFDVVIIQGYINTSAEKDGRPRVLKQGQERAELYLDYLAKIVAEVRKAGAIPVIYGHHRNIDSSPSNWEFIAEVFAVGQKRNKVTLVPAGSIWQESRKKYPDIILHHKDRHHQGLNGMYLNACLFATLLTGKSQEGAAALGGVRSSDARKLQKVAWKAMQETNAGFSLTKSSRR